MNRSSYIPANSEKESQTRFSSMLKSSNSKRPLSLDTSVCVGNQAKIEFLDTYLNLPLISERNRLEKVEDTPHVAYLGEIDKMHIRPQPFGIIRRKGPNTFIDIHMYSMGDTFAEAFSKGVKQYKEIANLNLKSNRLTDSGAAKILSEIHSKKVKLINLSDNKLGRLSIVKIIEIVGNNETRLRTLELENISISERTIFDLCKILADNKVLHNLNLAKNSLGYIACMALKEMLHYNSSLRHLDLHWNRIRTEGAVLLMEGLSQNDGLKVLDLSWNSFGRDQTQDSVKTLGRALKLNSTLVHLDLSYNNLSFKDCEVLSELIKDNHEVIGLHMVGNECRVDAFGFIRPIVTPQIMQQSHFFNRILDKSKYSKHHQAKSSCWICDKWIEMDLEFKQNDMPYEPKNIHFSVDNFQPTPLKKQKSDCFAITRVFPPGKVCFYFTNHMAAFTSKPHKTCVLDEPIPPSGPIKEVTIVNIMDVSGIECNLKELFASKARVNYQSGGVSGPEYEKIPWSLPISVFASYLLDSTEIKTECFEFDWDNSKLSTFIKEDSVREEAKVTLRNKYDPLLEAYKTLSALSGNETFAIGSNILNDFLNQCKIFDNLFTQSDMGVNWKTVNVPKEKSQQNNSLNGLCRYEFLEILTRIAQDRFVRSNISTNINEAVKKLFTDHIEGVIEKYNTANWRTTDYMTEEIDYVLKAYRPLLENLYKKYSENEMIPGQKHSLSLGEFRSICIDAKIVNEDFTSREIDMCYSRAMMTQTDYLNKTRHLEMNYVEFLEAISRAANEMQGTSLKSKIEGIMPSLLSICSPNFIKNYEYPTEETYFSLMYRIKQPIL